MKQHLLYILIALLSLGLSAPAMAQKAKPKTPAKTTTAKKKTTTTTQKGRGGGKTKPLSERERLQQEQKRKQQEIAQKKRRIAELEGRVKKGLQDVMLISTEIDDKRRTIDTIRRDLGALDATIATLDSQLVLLQGELAERRQRYISSVRYMHRNRKAQNRMLFVFSAKNFNQMYRRQRFVNQYATYQKAQGEAVKQKQEQVEQKQKELQQARQRQAGLLARGEQERQELEQRQTEQQRMVESLRKEQKTTQTLLALQQKEEAELNTRIERLIAEEIAREKARQEAERKRKAEAEAQRKKQEQERQRKLAAAREAERLARAAEKAAKNEQQKEAARKLTRKAEQQRRDAEREQARAEKSEQKKNSYAEPEADRQLSGSFAANKGRLPVPITGAYKIVRGFGKYNVEGLSSVQLDSKGIHIKGQPGAKARCVFNGQVSRIFTMPGSDRFIVMVRHGRYISVYCNLAQVSVSAGQQVSTNQVLGALGSDNVLQFQLRNWTELLNPRSWIGR